MTSEEFVAAMQGALGAGYTVASAATERPFPQFDVHPEPRESDDEGNEYRVTFSVRPADLATLHHGHVLTYAGAAVSNIVVQRAKGVAPPMWGKP